MITFIKVKEQAPPRADAFYAPEIEHQAEPMRRFQGREVARLKPLTRILRDLQEAVEDIYRALPPGAAETDYSAAVELAFDQFSEDFEDWLTGARNEAIEQAVEDTAKAMRRADVVMEHVLHGADGRFVKHHADKKGLTLMSARVDAEGGFTFDPVMKGKGPPPKGYALSTHKGTEEVHKDWAQRPAKERRRILENYTHRHWEKLRDDGSFIGGWKDGGDFYLDISTVVQDRKKAVDLGKQNSQIAIFDLEKGESIYMENE